MKALADERLYQTVHDYLCVYLPKMKKCSENTIRSYRKALSSLFDYVAEQEKTKLTQISFAMITDKALTGYLDQIEGKGGSIITRNQRLQAIRSFYHYAAMSDPALMIYQNWIDKVPAKKDTKREAVDYLKEDEVKVLLEQPDTATEKGIRDQFLLLMMYDSAARVQEIVDLRICDLSTGNSPTLTLHGKGEKTRIVPLMASTIKHYERYMAMFHPDMNEAFDEHLFFHEMHGTRKKLDTSTIRKMIRRYGNSARDVLPSFPENIHPHLLRHSRAMHLYQHGMDLTLISQWLGHAQMETTLIYAHADTEQKRKAIEQATASSNILKNKKEVKRFVVSDDEMLKRLYGLK